jgi:hypothetical protein
MSVSLNSLRLVYPPFSNQEGEWFKDDKEVVALLKTSNLYMIGRRQEVLFEWDEAAIKNTDPQSVKNLAVTLRSKDKTLAISGFLALPMFLEANADSSKTFLFEFGDKLFRVSDSETGEVLWWYTTDHLLYWKAHGDPQLIGFENYRDLTKYELFYVGISNKQDSFQRLLENAHHARISILSNETQEIETARLTDEVILFFFTTSSTLIRVMTTLEDLDNFGSGLPFTDSQVVADAEKAFVKLLKTQYNEEKFKSFPKGKDGLYASGLKGYVHLIDEDIEFTTSSSSFYGAFGHRGPWSVPSDAIKVEGDTATLIKAWGGTEDTQSAEATQTQDGIDSVIE